MPEDSKNNKENNKTELTVREAAGRLDVSESTVKKYLKDFDLSMEKGTGSKPLILQETFAALSEIVKLRANGMSIQEIKDLKLQKPSLNYVEEMEEEEKEIKTKERQKKQDLTDDITESEDISDEDVPGEDVPSEDVPGEDLKADETTEEEKGIRRRRLFNYRYVERQVSSDSKRINSLRLRLRNPNLSSREKLHYEEALERRILFLNGWRHILKWVSSK